MRATALVATVAGTIAGWLCSQKDAVNDSLGAADALACCYGVSRAVIPASAALHAKITINDPRLLILDCEDAVRTNFDTPSTADAYVCIETQRHHIP